MHALLGLPMELHQTRLAIVVHHPEGVHTEPLHGAERPGQRSVGHVPDGVSLRFGVQGHKVPERVVGALRLRDLSVRVWLAGVDHVRELDAVLDEEHRDVVADQVVVALVGVEAGRETAGVPGKIGRPAGAEHGGEPDEYRRLGATFEETGLANAVSRAVADEHTVRAGSARMNHALRDAFVVEVADLLPEVVILQQSRSA